MGIAIIPLLVKLLPSILSLMTLAEKYLGDKQGANKKELVMSATQVILDGVQEVSTGGQKETWDRIAAPVGAIIDNAATIMFPNQRDVYGGP